MKNKMKFMITILLSTFLFINHVSAATPLKCYYRSNDKTNGTFDLAELTVTDASKNNAKLKFTALKGPKLNCNVASDIAIGGLAGVGGAATGIGLAAGVIPGLIIGGVSLGASVVTGIVFKDNTCSFKTNRLNSTKTSDYSKKASKSIDKNLKYYDTNKKLQTIKNVPNIGLIDGECPEYVGVVISDIHNSKNVQVYAGSGALKNTIDSYINNNPDYNYTIWGEKYQIQGKNPDQVSSTDEEPIDTCEGLLGIRDLTTNEYTQGSVGFLLQQIFDYMKMAAIILIFAFSVIDYAKAIGAQDSEIFKKANKNLLKRILFGIIFFLIPELVNLILSVIDSSTCGIK